MVIIPGWIRHFSRQKSEAGWDEVDIRLQQMTILRDLLLLLHTAKEPGILMDLPYKWKRSTYEEVTWDSFVTSRKD